MISPLMMHNAGREADKPKWEAHSVCSTELVWLKLMIPHQGLTQTMNLKYQEVSRNDMALKHI